MSAKQVIGIDLDGILIGPPFFVPKAVIEHLYKRSNKNLSYRIPGKLEREIRSLSHYHLLRPPIKRNIDALSALSKKEDLYIELVSSRFSFLKHKTKSWTDKHELDKLFKKMFLNLNDEQPHLFKDRIIKSEKIQKFIDDDLDLLIFLAKNNPKVKFYWVDPKGTNNTLPENIKWAKDLSEFKDRYL